MGPEDFSFADVQINEIVIYSPVEDRDDVEEVRSDDGQVVTYSDGCSVEGVGEVSDDGLEGEAEEQGSEWVALPTAGG